MMISYFTKKKKGIVVNIAMEDLFKDNDNKEILWIILGFLEQNMKAPFVLLIFS